MHYVALNSEEEASTLDLKTQQIPGSRYVISAMQLGFKANFKINVLMTHQQQRVLQKGKLAKMLTNGCLSCRVVRTNNFTAHSEVLDGPVRGESGLLYYPSVLEIDRDPNPSVISLGTNPEKCGTHQ